MSKLDVLAQQVEQAEAGVLAVANLTTIYFNKLLEDKNIKRSEAMELTKVFVASFIQAQRPPSGNK